LKRGKSEKYVFHSTAVEDFGGQDIDAGAFPVNRDDALKVLVVLPSKHSMLTKGAGGEDRIKAGAKLALPDFRRHQPFALAAVALAPAETVPDGSQGVIASLYRIETALAMLLDHASDLLDGLSLFM
jgi:hypothetical protein